MEKKKFYTDKRYLHRPVKCLETGEVYEDIRKAGSVIYGIEFRYFNDLGRAIERQRRVKGNHYIFL